MVALEGPSGAGKSTAAERVARALGGVVLTEAYRRLRPTPSLAFVSDRALATLEGRLLREEARRYSFARATARLGRTAVADTGFLGPLTYTWALVRAGLASPGVLSPLVHQAEALAARGRWGVPDLIVYLDTRAGERRRRIAEDPTGHPTDLAARHEAIGRIERAYYRRRLAPLLGDRYRSVPAEGPPATVARRVLRVIRRSPRAPPRRTLARELLRAFAPSP